MGSPKDSNSSGVFVTPRLVDGKYRLGRVIGEGGMGAVFEAEHVGLGIKVAVKLLNDLFTDENNAVSRFRREARAAAAVRHQNVVAVTDTGTDHDGTPFIVMELLEGESLSSVLRRQKLFSPFIATDIACQILSGLSAAHEKKVIHRDLKPGNILLTQSSEGGWLVKILDFGISKTFFSEGHLSQVTATGAVVGTPRFMAPEQASGKADLDGRVDIYAVGVLLYRMVTGKLPFSGKTNDEVMRQIVENDIIRPSEICPFIDYRLERVILKAMATDRNQRYQTADDFMRELKET
ncbi:MAG: serine/threonine-protein kinase, partial [Pseudomonadota bacterium]